MLFELSFRFKYFEVIPSCAVLCGGYRHSPDIGSGHCGGHYKLSQVGGDHQRLRTRSCNNRSLCPNPEFLLCCANACPLFTEFFYYYFVSVLFSFKNPPGIL